MLLIAQAPLSLGAPGEAISSLSLWEGGQGGGFVLHEQMAPALRGLATTEKREYRTSPFCHCEAPAGAVAIPKVARSAATRQSHEIASPEARNDNRLGEVLKKLLPLGTQ